MITLMDHQTEAIEAVEAQFEAGVKRTLAVLATGTGKTIIYLCIAKRWVAKGCRVLILAHREELIHQPLERARKFFPNLAKKMGIVMAQEDNPDAQIVIATIQTASRNQARLERMGHFDLVILDECHHGTAKSYLKLVDRFSNARWLGLTATPFRSDGDSLSKVFDSVAYRLPITASIERGILVPFNAFGFSLPVSTKGIVETEDGWEEVALGELLSAANVLEIVYESWEAHCRGRKTICFTSSVGQAYATAKFFRKAGVRAEAVDGKTPKKIRRQILHRFETGQTDIVVNCQVWTEGVDVPEASAALMICPTRSDLAYVQKLGRVLRIFEGKKDAIILDFSPAEDRNIVMAGDILGVPRIVKKAKAKAEKGGVIVRHKKVKDHGLQVTIDPADVLVETLTYLRKGRLAWVLQDYFTAAAVSEQAMLAIETPNVERIANAEAMMKGTLWTPGMELLYKSLKFFRLWVCSKERNSWKAEFLGNFRNIDDAVDYGESRTHLLFRASLARKRKNWRNRPASIAQLAYMGRLGIECPDNCNQGQAAQLISFTLAEKAVGKARPALERAIMNGKEFPMDGKEVPIQDNI